MNERIKELMNQTGIPTSIPFDQWCEKFAAIIVAECGYYADVFEAVGCPVDMDPTETKPSNYIKREMGITEWKIFRLNG
jgi:hypothetical protein